jgi:hypothetical protein
VKDKARTAVKKAARYWIVGISTLVTVLSYVVSIAAMSFVYPVSKAWHLGELNVHLQASAHQAATIAAALGNIEPEPPAAMHAGQYL